MTEISDNTPPVDPIDKRALEQLQELVGGERESLVELIETFLIEGQDIVKDMKNSVPMSDLDLLRRSAHSMKSSAQDFGATRLSEHSGFLEYSCKSGWPERAEEQIASISQQFSLSAEALKEYLSN